MTRSPIAPGFRLDRYELICPIAEGGMASVWIARQQGKHGFQKLVAVKTILPKYADEPRFQRMFVDEARIASKIDHANVTRILDVGDQNDVTYLVMEYVDGDALSRLHRAAQRKEKLVPPGIVLRVMADVCGGLHAAHELLDDDGLLLGVVHRDVSPQNVLVSSTGAAKLIDFGIAKAKDRVAGDTNADQLKGKVVYMAPEQALGRVVDRRADIWAVGAVLYHLLSGSPPYDAGGDVPTLLLLTSGRPPAPLPDHVPAPVAAVVARALAISPDARYATAAEVQAALEQAMIEAKLTTTARTVAAYVGETLGDRGAKRKDTIALGLRAADERDKVADIMRSNAAAHEATSASGGAQGITAAFLGESSLSTGTGTGTGTGTSGQTLGSAAMVVPMEERARARKLAIAGGVALAAVGGMLAVLSMRTPADARSSPARALAPATTTAAPPPPPEAPAAVAPPATSTSTSSSSSSSTPTPTPTTPPPKPRWISSAPHAPPATAVPARAASTTKPRVNDGF